jgi:integrase/recombinase XerD
MTPRRQRDIEDMPRRHDAPNTPALSGACVSLVARSCKRSPELLGPAHMRAYPRALVQEQKRAWSRFHQTVCALRLRSRIPRGTDWRITHSLFPRAEQKLPMGRSQTAGAPCVAASPPLTSRTVLMPAYAAGWRLSEARHWPGADRDAPRLVMCVRQGQGPKARDLRRSPPRLAR